MKQCKPTMRKSSSFLRFLKTKHTSPIMKRDLEYKFFREFQYDGAAIMSLEMMLFEHCKISNGTVSREGYPKSVLGEIRERTESYEQFDAWPWGGMANCSPLMDEIADNLAMLPDDGRNMYAEELLCKMQTWVWLYSLSREKLDALSNSIALYSVEYYFSRWRSAFRSFAEKLAVILVKLGMNILEIQNRCGFKIIERLDINELWMSFGTPQLAEYHLSKLHGESIVSKPNKSVKLGRPNSKEIPFRNLIIASALEKERILQLLHQSIDGRKGKDAAFALLACLKAGKLTSKPTFAQIQGEFGNVGSKSGFNQYYYAEHKFDESSLNVMIEMFKK